MTSVLESIDSDAARKKEEVRAMLYLDGASNVPALTAYMLNSALDRQAIAPMWEVKTARLQQEVGDPNAGLTEEERAAKAGLAAPLDTPYAASHASDPEARNKRAGHFMAVGLDLNGDGHIESRSIAQNAAAGAAISFDWDGQGYQKKTGWIGAQDGFLMLDHNFNQSADNAKELLSNPLIADAGKGLRTLAAYDANGDGKIDASDPVYQQLKVWQDLDQDGDNTQANSGKPDSSQHLGLIASRLPWLHFTGNEDGGGTFSMSWTDSQTGAVHTRQFSMDGDYLGSGDGAEIANSEDFFKSMGQQFIEIAMDSCYESNSWLRPLHMGKTTVSHASSLVETASSAFWRAVA